MPFFDRRINKWIGQIRIKGRKPESKAFATKREAKAWEVEGKKLAKKPPEIVMDFSETYMDYLDHAKQRYTHNTYVEKVATGRRFVNFLGGSPALASISAEMVHNFLLHSASERSSNRSNRDRKNLLAFWSWAQRILDWQSNPVVKCQKLPHSRKAQFVPMESEIKQILMACTRKERVFLNCYLQTAARRSSVFRWKWNEDIDFGLRQVRIGHSKSKDGSMEYLWLPMTRELEEDLRWWYRNRTIRSEWVFVVEEGPYTGTPFTYRHKFLKGLCSRSSVKPFGFHSLRRYAATKLAQSGVPMSTIQRILGHKNLSTTERYLGRVNEDLRGFMELLCSGNHSGILDADQAKNGQKMPELANLNPEIKPC